MLLNQVLGCAETLLAHDGNTSVMPIQTSCLVLATQTEVLICWLSVQQKRGHASCQYSTLTNHLYLTSMSGDGWSEEGESVATSSQQLLCGAGLVLEPLPVGAGAFLSVTAAVFTKTLTFSQAFSAFTNDVIWLIVVSFFFAKVCENLGSCMVDCHDV